MTSAAVDLREPVDTQAHTTASIVTTVLAIVLLLLLWFIKIYTPIPPIPPDKEPPTIELYVAGAAGGNNMEMGGGSQGNTGDPGSQNMDVNPDKANPSNPGAITNPNSDAAHSQAKPTPGSNEASVSDETLALMEKQKNKKNNTTIKIGGDGSGSPYSSGKGDNEGIGTGDKDGGIPNPNGTGGGAKHYRKIIFKPDIANPTQEEAVVAVVVRVRRDGTVAHAVYTPKGTTTGNSLLHSTATQSAYKILFDEDLNGPELLELTININFTLNK